jgi:hypothetical protein
LVGARSKATSDHAADLIVHFGEFALPALYYKLNKLPESRLLQRIASILGSIGVNLPPVKRVRIQKALDIRLGRCRKAEVAKTIMEVQLAIRPR